MNKHTISNRYIQHKTSILKVRCDNEQSNFSVISRKTEINDIVDKIYINCLVSFNFSERDSLCMSRKCT